MSLPRESRLDLCEIPLNSFRPNEKVYFELLLYTIQAGLHREGKVEPEPKPYGGPGWYTRARNHSLGLPETLLLEPCIRKQGLRLLSSLGFWIALAKVVEIVSDPKEVSLALPFSLLSSNILTSLLFFLPGVRDTQM